MDDQKPYGLKAEETLKEIIQLQSLLDSAKFDLSSFMNMVVKQLEELTSATGAAVELSEAEEIIHHADQALYKVKKSGSKK